MSAAAPSRGRRARAMLLAPVCALALPLACASRPQPIGADVTVYANGLERVEYIDGVGMVKGIWRDGDVVIAGNPSAEELSGVIQAFGIALVVNLAPRSFVERNAPYDERAIVESLGAEHLWLPMEAGETQSPARADRVGAALVGGPILLHGAWLGDSAAHWWALAVRMGGMDPVEAGRAYLQMTEGIQVFPIEGYANARLVPVDMATSAPIDAPPTIDNTLDLPLRAATVGALREVGGAEGIDGLAIDGRFFVGGQPTEAWLEEQASAGLRSVINLRRHDEMERVSYDEAAACARLGVEYVHIPTGWSDADYTPEALDRFAAATRTVSGRALIHCQVGWRATHLWAAYLHRHRGVPANEALRRAFALQGSWPFTAFERLAGVELEWDLIDR